MRSWIKGGGVFRDPSAFVVPALTFLWRLVWAGRRRRCWAWGGPLLVCGGVVWRYPTVVGAFSPLPGRAAACSGGTHGECPVLWRCDVLWCAVLCRAVLCRAAPCRSVLCCGVLCSVVLCLSVSGRGVSCRGVACCAVPCRAAPCRVVVCRVVGCPVVVRCTTVCCGAVCRVASCGAVYRCAVLCGGAFSLPFWRGVWSALVRLAGFVVRDA